MTSRPNPLASPQPSSFFSSPGSILFPRRLLSVAALGLPHQLGASQLPFRILLTSYHRERILRLLSLPASASSVASSALIAGFSPQHRSHRNLQPPQLPPALLPTVQHALPPSRRFRPRFILNWLLLWSLHLNKRQHTYSSDLTRLLPLFLLLPALIL